MLETSKEPSPVGLRPRNGLGKNLHGKEFMYSRRWTGAAWVIGLVAGLSLGLSPASAEDKKEPAKKPEVKPRLSPAGTINAQVVEVDGATLRVRLPQAGKPNYQPRNKEGDNASDLELTLADDVKIRVPLKPEFDDKGRPKPPPRKDPKDPDRNLPGVRGSTSDLTKGAHLTISVSQTREKQPKTVATLILVTDEGGRKEKK